APLSFLPQLALATSLVPTRGITTMPRTVLQLASIVVVPLVGTMSTSHFLAPPGPPTPCTIQGCVGPYFAYLVAICSLFFVDLFLIAVFLIVGQRPVLDARNGKFTWPIQHWHGLRNAAIISVIVFTLLYIPAVLYQSPQLSDSAQFGLLLFRYSMLFHSFLRFLLLVYFILAVLFAIFLLILWLRKRPQVAGLSMTVRALAFQNDGTLLAGTTQGIYRSRDSGQTWQW